MRVTTLLHGKYDASGAFLSIQAGAGGTESCDWVQMLLRMYQRWCDKQDYRIRLLDQQEAEGGIKSVTVEVEGSFVYGYLQGESGIHRLVRISPFDSGGRRHTTFASVHISPMVNQEIDIDIKPDDIRIDTYRASGAGGQHVNKTDSAVRITHHASGIVVQCQNERSQHMNKESAMRILLSRLYEFYLAQQKQQQQAYQQQKKGISWGNQIRSYVFHPYTLVKDHRFQHETGNINAVMDGEIGQFIEGFLLTSCAK